MKKDRERLELTFGAKDADLWQYLEQTGLPKASLVKKIIRDKMEAENGTAVTPTAVPAKVEPVEEKVAEVEPVKEVVEEQPVKEKKPGMFGGLATKR